MTQKLEAMKLAFELLRKKEWEACDYISNASEAANILEKAIEQAKKPTEWISKEQLLQEWLPRLWDALRDVRHNENAAAEETLYELYVEMKQETLAEKIDTMSHITPEDQLSAVISELQATQKRLADTENILCRQHFEQAQKQEPVAWMDGPHLIMRTDWRDKANYKGPWVDLGRAIPDAWKPVLYTSPPQRQPLTLVELSRIFASIPSVPFEGEWQLELARAIEAAHGIKGEA